MLLLAKMGVGDAAGVSVMEATAPRATPAACGGGIVRVRGRQMGVGRCRQQASRSANPNRQPQLGAAAARLGIILEGTPLCPLASSRPYELAWASSRAVAAPLCTACFLASFITSCCSSGDSEVETDCTCNTTHGRRRRAGG